MYALQSFKKKTILTINDGLNSNILTISSVRSFGQQTSNSCVWYYIIIWLHCLNSSVKELSDCRNRYLVLPKTVHEGNKKKITVLISLYSLLSTADSRDLISYLLRFCKRFYLIVLDNLKARLYIVAVLYKVRNKDLKTNKIKI